GAGAFIGPYWSVRDQAAGSFARAFYRELLTGEPIGEAARRARLEVREKHPGNPTWLAYTVYADPLARVV
ncbi:MAG TPA: CHAT domain-containing protein, partial [Thermoanaerobaculia bacterium]|nr:CHAT domain-containing protein [Thermoanaerobaculia bacterium]